MESTDWCVCSSFFYFLHLWDKIHICLNLCDLRRWRQSLYSIFSWMSETFYFFECISYTRRQEAGEHRAQQKKPQAVVVVYMHFFCLYVIGVQFWMIKIALMKCSLMWGRLEILGAMPICPVFLFILQATLLCVFSQLSLRVLNKSKHALTSITQWVWT